MPIYQSPIWKWLACVMIIALVPAAECVAQAAGATPAGRPDSLPGRVVDVKAGEFYFLAPDTIPAGLTTFRLHQVGLVVERVRAGATGRDLVSDQGNPTRGLHMLWVVRLEQGKTVEDLHRAVLAAEPRVWAQNLGGPGFSLPPATTNATLNLAAGNYALICYVGAATGDRTRHHALNGMFRALTVTGSNSSEAHVAAPDVVARITGEGIVEFSTSPVAGRQVIRVENATLRDHEFKMQKVPAGQTGKDWLTAPSGNTPPTPLGGLASVPPGSAVTTTVHFSEPGEYIVSSWASIRHPTSGVIVVAAGRH
jgi:hypothetical protein